MKQQQGNMPDDAFALRLWCHLLFQNFLGQKSVHTLLSSRPAFYNISCIKQHKQHSSILRTINTYRNVTTMYDYITSHFRIES